MGWKDTNQKLCKVSFAVLEKFRAKLSSCETKTRPHNFHKYTKIFVHQKGSFHLKRAFATLKNGAIRFFFLFFFCLTFSRLWDLGSVISVLIELFQLWNTNFLLFFSLSPTIESRPFLCQLFFTFFIFFIQNTIQHFSSPFTKLSVNRTGSSGLSSLIFWRKMRKSAITIFWRLFTKELIVD